jgi:hypothetical protein
MFAAMISLPPFRGFVGAELAKLGGRHGIGTPPTSASRALIFASARPALISSLSFVDHVGRRARRCADPWRLTSNSAKVNVAPDEPDTLVIIGEILRHALSESAENDEEESTDLPRAAGSSFSQRLRGEG